MRLQTPSNVAEPVQMDADKKQKERSAVLRPLHSFPIFEIYGPEISSFTSIMELRGSVVSKLWISAQEPASSCCSSMLMKQSFLFPSNVSTWYNVIPVP